MKKRDLASLAMIGISAGLLVAGCQTKPSHPPGGSRGNTAAAEQMSPDMQSFYNNLSPEAQQKFMQMDAQHRMMAMEMTEQNCKGQNACKGLGGCKGATHACAGKNGCKGQGEGPPVRDPNKAVDIQYQMNQRGQMNNTMRH